MYLQIEEEFKKQSKTRNAQVLFVLGTILLALICTMLLDKIAEKNNYKICYAIILLIGAFVFYTICYIFMFVVGLSKKQRSFKQFFKIKDTIHSYQGKLHSDDIKILQGILKNHKINTRPKIEEAIKHYQCLLPRKVSQPGQLLTILAFVISTLALFASETVISSTENIQFIAGILFTVIIIYAMVRLIEKNIFRVFGKDALYMRIEDSLSEIFMTYYLKKEEQQENEND